MSGERGRIRRQGVGFGSCGRQQQQDDLFLNIRSRLSNCVQKRKTPAAQMNAMANERGDACMRFDWPVSVGPAASMSQRAVSGDLCILQLELIQRMFCSPVTQTP
jgi:hypothetical protein